MDKLRSWNTLDPRSLNVTLAVLEERSVSRAASRLELSQSAVSHTLERLRLRFDDPLFVRKGRGIAPTRRALDLEMPIRRVLDELRALAQRRGRWYREPCDLDEPFVYLPLQFSPEISTLTHGLRHENQAELVSTLAKYLPSGLRL